jgi:hypothetical protein
VINGATQIIGNVPGQYLNPLLVAESQTMAHAGYVVVSYSIEPKQYDLLFLQGRAITHCARMNKDLRFFVDQHVVTTTFRDHYNESHVFLFTSDDESIHRFIATFHSEPCLKVHVDALSKPQILALIKSTGCSQGIIERNDFSNVLPTIELNQIESTKKLPLFKTGLSHGRLLVYDLLKNQEIQSHRFAGEPFMLHPAPGPKRKRTPRKRLTNIEPTHVEGVSNSTSLPEDPAEAIEALIHEILGTTNHKPTTINELIGTESGSLVDSQSEATSSQPPTINNQPELNAQSQPSPPETSTELQSSIQETVSSKDRQTEQTVFTRTLERLVRSFRQQVVDLCPQRAESLFAQAEKKALMLNPDFSIRSLNDETARVVLDLIEEIVRIAPLLKRSKLRDIAAELVSDLYNKQYDLLEQHAIIDAVEQCYYRLKGSKG